MVSCKDERVDILKETIVIYESTLRRDKDFEQIKHCEYVYSKQKLATLLLVRMKKVVVNKINNLLEVISIIFITFKYFLS